MRDAARLNGYTSTHTLTYAAGVETSLLKTLIAGTHKNASSKPF